MADTHYRYILMSELVFWVDFKMILHKVSKGLSEVKNLIKYFKKFSITHCLLLFVLKFFKVTFDVFLFH